MNKRCFIFGNSPGLAEEDLRYIADEDIFICNRGYKIKGCVDFKFTNMKYYVLSDPKHAKVYIDEIVPNTQHMIKYVCSVLRPKEQGLLRGEIRFFNRTKEEEFGRWPQSLEQGWGRPRTVVADAIMIAYFLGYKEIYLLGVDLDYSHPTSNYFYPASAHDIRNKNNIPNSLEHILPALSRICLELCRKDVKLVNLSRGFKHTGVMPTATLARINKKNNHHDTHKD